MSRTFDPQFAREARARIRSIPEDAVPRWGRMRKGDLVGHLLAALRFSLGQASFDLPLQRSPWIRRVLKWLILDAGFPMLRNVQFRDGRGGTVPLAKLDGSPADLDEAIDRMAVATPKEVPSPPPHPYFGELTLDEWKRLHVRHFRHHLKQFGAPL